MGNRAAWCATPSASSPTVERVRAARPLILTLLAVALTAAPAHAAWVQTKVSQIPIDYYQGVTHDGAGHLFFDGPQHGGYRTDLALREQLRNPELIPADQPFNHIGDWSYDKAEGGRLILPPHGQPNCLERPRIAQVEQPRTKMRQTLDCHPIQDLPPQPLE